MSFVLGTSAGKSHLIHVVDTPGHVNFLDEVAAAIRLVDGILLVVDVLEGVRLYSYFHPPPSDDTVKLQAMVNTEKIIKHALQEGVKVTLVVNKLDRLILELRIKPVDAYYKIKHTIDEINTFIRYAH